MIRQPDRSRLNRLKKSRSKLMTSSRVKKIFSLPSWILRKTLPPLTVGALEITDSLIHFLDLQENGPKQASLRLPAGIIEIGQVKDKNKLIEVLRELHRRIVPQKRKTLNIILTIPSVNVYVQTLLLPLVAAENLEEAAELNLQMASPEDFKQSYSGWQEIGERSKGQIELLAAFAPRASIDPIKECLEESGFRVVAVEFTSLGIVRALKQEQLIEATKPYLVIQPVAEGINFIIIRDGQLLFHSFQSWKTIQEDGRAIELGRFETSLVSEINNLLNFFSTHWTEQINDLIVVTSDLQDEIRVILNRAFPNLEVTFLGPEKVAALIGAVYRGGLSRKGDREISLMEVSGLEIFEEAETLHFISVWRNILLATFGFLLIISLGSLILLRQLAGETVKANTLNLNQPETAELLALKEKAERFNQLVALVRETQFTNERLGSSIEFVVASAGPEIEISRFYLQSLDGPFTLSGVALGEQAAIRFKNRLINESRITDVQLPLSQITPLTGGKVGFIITFKVKPSNSAD